MPHKKKSKRKRGEDSDEVLEIRKKLRVLTVEVIGKTDNCSTSDFERFKKSRDAFMRVIVAIMEKGGRN